MSIPLPDSIPVDWRRQLAKLVDTLPQPLVQGIPAMKAAVDEARSVLPTNPDQETCRVLYERVSQSRLSVASIDNGQR